MDLLGKMQTFVRVVEAKNLSAAARQLHLSTAAVSRQVTLLETAVGASLLARSTRRMTVTATGQRYYERCLRVLREVEDAQSVGSEDLAGPLRLSVPVTIGLLAGVELLQPLLRDHPQLRLDVRLEDRVIDLALDDIDVAIRVGAAPPMSSDVIAVPLTTWHRIVVAAPSYLRRRGTPRTLAALATHGALSTLRDAASETWTLTDGSTTSQLRMRTRVSSNAGHLLHHLVRDGHGVALLPAWFVAPDLRRKRLVHVMPAYTSGPVTIRALYRTALRHEKRVRLLVDHLRRTYAATEQRR